MWLTSTINTYSLSSDSHHPETTLWDFKKLDLWAAKIISNVRR